MKNNRIVIALSLLTITLTSLAAVAGCGPGQLLGPTFTPTSTVTLTPRPTLTLTPTPTTIPTPTFTPSPMPTPTIVGEIGVPISNADWEITLIDPVSRQRIFRGSYYYTANPGYIFVDLGLRVKNLNTKTQSFLSSDVVVIDEEEQPWFILWMGRQPNKNNRIIDPFNISVDEFPQGSFPINVEGEVYFRFIFVVIDTSSSLNFQFNNLPFIPFKIEN